MTVYRIMIAGEGLRLKLDGEDADCGFYKNEYLWAKDESTAIAKARARVSNGLKNNAGVVNDLDTNATLFNDRENIDLSDLAMKVEEIETGLGILELRKRQGFVFYKVDAAGET
jgi:hypothetical protein